MSGGMGDSDEPAALAEPARQRLLTIAADVLGRMPPDEVPQTLRAFARFTPAKRARLGATALAATLDADRDFRERVADVVSEASPQLVDAVREGAPTTASDPLDVAVVAYLIRPSGWEESVAAATARWRDTAGADGAADDGARMRAELQDLRARVKAEPARVRDEVAAATAEVETQLADVRKQLRARTGELRAAERARDDALAEVADVRGELEASATARAAELRRLRTRIAELERAGESAR
ncbi:MAG TPA: hypothetical protein VJ831_06785, partial [Jatrophihabitantaceae bacterium]|nr:hypothetical protein [Jatrophihabitantaceae bacterium]